MQIPSKHPQKEKTLRKNKKNHTHLKANSNLKIMPALIAPLTMHITTSQK